MTEPGIAWIALFADVPAADVAAASKYWQAIAGPPDAFAPTGRDEFAPLSPGAVPVLWLQRLDSAHRGWHLDLYPTDHAAAVTRALSAGARVVREDEWFVSLASPAGLPFCLTRLGDRTAEAAPALVRPDGHRSAVDQMCLDLPATGYDAEADFWAALTGWPRTPGRRPEFEYLPRPDDVVVRILLQRLEPDDTSGARMHVDLATDDRVAETAWHVAAGGRVLRTEQFWTTLRDPAGLVYCITDRAPR